MLDFGGSGKRRTLVLLTALGDNAHVYDDFAVQFTDSFHVIGITRRGFLPSSQPATGHDVATRVRDDIRVMDALGIARASFAGQSLAGSELSRLGSEYPKRIEKLVYLDAYDLATRFQRPDVPRTGVQQLGHSCAPGLSGSPGAPVRDPQDRRVDLPWPGLRPRGGDRRLHHAGREIPAALLAGFKAPTNPLVDLAGDQRAATGHLRGLLDQSAAALLLVLNPAAQALFDKNFPGIVAWQKPTIARFGRHGPGATPIVWELLAFTSHYIFINRKELFVREMRRFLQATPEPRTRQFPLNLDVVDFSPDPASIPGLPYTRTSHVEPHSRQSSRPCSPGRGSRPRSRPSPRRRRPARKVTSRRLQVYRSTILRHRSALKQPWAGPWSDRPGPGRVSCSRAAR